MKMKNNLKRIISLSLILYFIPFTFIGMLWDFKYRTIFGYIIMITIPIILAVIATKHKMLYIVIIGNIVSHFVTYYFVSNIDTLKWSAYFKPFYPVTIALIITLLNIIPQVISIIITKKRILQYIEERASK
jgi:hypothetical protein